ncbi:MAG: hypothetical protein CM1200mP22_25470 [Dehalococcoidia bacterium]|nr:MAG: hypothetical protein CM1200mP22_25470 [Dehalococcoidia bacterium]
MEALLSIFASWCSNSDFRMPNRNINQILGFESYEQDDEDRRMEALAIHERKAASVTGSAAHSVIHEA